jgi:hypothetical protein
LRIKICDVKSQKQISFYRNEHRLAAADVPSHVSVLSDSNRQCSVFRRRSESRQFSQHPFALQTERKSKVIHHLTPSQHNHHYQYSTTQTFHLSPQQLLK